MHEFFWSFQFLKIRSYQTANEKAGIDLVSPEPFGESIEWIDYLSSFHSFVIS